MLSTSAIIGSKAKITTPLPPSGLWIQNSPGNPGYMDGGWNAVSGATRYDYRIDIGGGYGFGVINFTSTTIFIGPYDEFDQVCVQVRVTTSGGTSDWSTAACEIVDTGGCSPTCLTGDALITMAENKRIADVKEGDMIVSQDEVTGELFDSEVLEIGMMKHDKMIKITFEDDSEITCTVVHPWKAEEVGWVSYDTDWTGRYYKNIDTISKLEIGQTLIGKDSNKTIKDIIPYVEEKDTYQIISLSKGNVYFANGLLTKVEH